MPPVSPPDPLPEGDSAPRGDGGGGRLRPRRARWLLVALAVALAAGWLAGGIAWRRSLATLTAATRTDAQLRAALLDSELARFRLLPRALVDDRDVTAALGGDVAARTTVDRKLEALARETGAAAIYVIAPTGRAIAASNWRTPASFVGTDYAFRRYFRDAARTGAASQFAMGTVSRRAGLYLARRAGGRGAGVVVVKLDFDRVEAAWARAGGITYAADGAGVVLVASRPAWRFAATSALSAGVRARIQAESNPGPGAFALLPARPARDGRGVIVAGARMVAATAATSQPGWRLTLLAPARPLATAAARTAAIGTALAVLALAAIGWAVRERAAVARERTAGLERAVAERTAALRREIDDHAASEARAADLREGLRQANRLATLGQVTASVAHETAQPVAAIRTYAEASAVLLDRGDAAQVRGNLATIVRLTERIGAVTAQLRGFARRGAGETGAVPLVAIIEGATLILKAQLRDIALAVPAIDPALMVAGGRVRLEQVLVNLLQNAAEALASTPSPRITLAVAIDADVVRLTIADNGPGIDAVVAERLFTPFATSRDSGLGLGLVIARDIMEDLGGTLRLVPATQGACFEIAMRRA